MVFYRSVLQILQTDIIYSFRSIFCCMCSWKILRFWSFLSVKIMWITFFERIVFWKLGNLYFQKDLLVSKFWSATKAVVEVYWSGIFLHLRFSNPVITNWGFPILIVPKLSKTVIVSVITFRKYRGRLILRILFPK